MGHAEPHRNVPFVLVIAADPNIESLVGELVAFAGYRPVFDVTVGAAGESVRRVRPDITLIDTSLNKSVVKACLNAADEVGSRPVLMSSTASDSELFEEARSQGCLHFPLPGGPKPLERVLERALAREVPVPPPLESTVVERASIGSVHPALCAALASVSSAHAAAMRSRPGRVGPMATDESAVAHPRSQAALRAAVADYARQLRAADVPEEEAVTSVLDSIVDCGDIVGDNSVMSAILAESENWTRQVYRRAQA